MCSAQKRKQSFKKRFQHQPIFREKFMYTIWICWAFVMLVCIFWTFSNEY